PDQELTAENVRQNLLDLAGQRPGLLAGIALAVLLLGAVVFARPAKVAARIAAVWLVFERRLSLPAAWSAAGRPRWQGLGGVLLVTAGAQSFLAALFLLPLAIAGTAAWQELGLLVGLSLVLLGAGALGLGRVAVEGTGQREGQAGTVGTFL